MFRRRLGIALSISVLALVLPTSVSAAAPEHFETTFIYTLADAIADYEAFGDNAGDCGSFVLLVDFTVQRDVTVWPDREVRHVKYIGNFYSSVDTTRSIVRGGNFNLTFSLDANGDPTGLTRTGVFEYAVVDGARVVTHVGRDEIDFATGPISSTPMAGDAVRQAVCDALR